MDPLIIVTLLALYKKAELLLKNPSESFSDCVETKLSIERNFLLLFPLSELSLFFLMHSLTLMHF